MKNKGKAVAKGEDEDSEYSLIVSPPPSHSDEWILNSGCIYHMSPVREWIFNFEINERVVYMGNVNACKATGVGSIRLKNHNRLTRILTNVRYMSNLKKNLISLGALESKGLVVTMQDGILKATSGALTVMKGIT